MRVVHSFELGSSNTYNGSAVVSRSLHSGQPIIFVSVNYRLNAFGFLGGKEVKAAGIGNLGLQDQRYALKWVNKYISLFGGDPTQVTIWGESAGAISCTPSLFIAAPGLLILTIVGAMHMLANGGNTEGLFRGAVMNSGSPIPVADIVNGQSTYDAVVKDAGCASAADTLQCLRTADYKTFFDAMNKQPLFLNYQTLHLAYLPRAVRCFYRVKSPAELASAMTGWCILERPSPTARQEGPIRQKHPDHQRRCVPPSRVTVDRQK